MEELNGYVEHYLRDKNTLIFILLSLCTVLIAFVIIYFYARIKYAVCDISDYEDYDNPLRIIFKEALESFYELIFSGTGILFFMAVYYLVERFVDFEPVVSIWAKHKDFILLFLIVLSCILNSLLDRVLVRFKHLDQTKRSSIRLLGMLYMITIFAYIKFIYENNNYDFFISYFLGLMVGRFVYFDASFKDFIVSFINAIKNLPVMLLSLSATSLMALYGFKSKYLIVHIGVITNVFFIHLFLCLGIFVIHHLHLADLLTHKAKR